MQNLHRTVQDPKESGKRHQILPSRRPYLLALPDSTFMARNGDDRAQHVQKEMTPLNFNFRQWKGTFESVLLRKATELFSELASLALEDGTNNAALRFLRLTLLLLTSIRSLEWVNVNKETDLLPIVLCKCADMYMSVAKTRDVYLSTCEENYSKSLEHEHYFATNYQTADKAVYDLKVDLTTSVVELLEER